MTQRHTPKPWKKVNTRKMRYPYENGTTLPTVSVTLYLDPRDTPSFCYMLPVWVRDQLGISDEIHADTAEQAAEAWDRIVEKWSLHVRTAMAEPVILLEVSGRYEDEDGERGQKFGENNFHFDGPSYENPKVGLSIAFELAFRVNGHVHYRQRDRKVDDENDPKAYIVGTRMSSPHGVVLDYSPELHARIEEIRATLSRAGRAIEAILKSADVGKALLASKAFRALPAPDATANSQGSDSTAKR